MTGGVDAAHPIAVFGASGQVGAGVLARCRERGIPVLALGRTAPEAGGGDGVEWCHAQLPDAVPVLPPVRALLSLGPLDLFSRWLAATPLPGAPRVIALGSMSAESKVASALPAERELASRLLLAEQAVARRCEAAGQAWTIFRPTMLYGLGRDHNVAAVMRWALRWGVLPMPRARGLRQPLHVDDLAEAVLAAIPATAAHGRVLPIGGGERLTVAAMFDRLRAALPARVLPLPVPAWLSRAAQPLAAYSRLAAVLARFDTDLVADNEAVEHLLGVHPRGFAPPAPVP